MPDYPAERKIKGKRHKLYKHEGQAIYLSDSGESVPAEEAMGMPEEDVKPAGNVNATRGGQESTTHVFGQVPGSKTKDVGAVDDYQGSVLSKIKPSPTPVAEPTKVPKAAKKVGSLQRSALKNYKA